MSVHVVDNSAKRWENLLAEITHVELLAAKSRSLVDKLFGGNVDEMDEKVSNIGCHSLAE